MNQIEVLTDVGLKPAEARVYAGLLELGESSVQTIAHKARLQRPNCYAILESLRQKNLVSLAIGDRGRRYIAENPKRLKELMKTRLDQLDEVLPKLQLNYNSSPAKPQVRYYEGRTDIYRLYNEILRAKDYDAIYSPEFLLQEMDEYVGYFGRVVAEKKIKMREIITGNVVPSHYTGLFKEPLQQVRYLSPNAPTRTEFILYENKLALLAYRPTVHALVVEGSDIIQTMSLLFEQLWRGAARKFSGKGE